MKKQETDLEKIIAHHEGLVFRMYKALSKLNSKKTTRFFFLMGKRLE